MEKYTELDILKAEAEIKRHESKLTAMKQKREVYRDYQDRLNSDDKQDITSDDLMREYARIDNALNREITEIEEQLVRDARHAYDNRDEFWGIPIYEGFVDNPKPLAQNEILDTINRLNDLLLAIADKLGVLT